MGSSQQLGSYTREDIVTLRQDIFSFMYESDDVDQGVQTVMERVGRFFGVSRVYIFENTEGNTHANNTFEWCAPGIVPEKDNLQNMSYEEYGYSSLFKDSGEFFCPDTSLLPSPARELMEGQGILATLQYGIYSKGVFRGIVGFDDCIQTRPEWGTCAALHDTLVYIARLLSICLMKERNLQRANRMQEQLKEKLVLEQQLKLEAQKASQSKSTFLSGISHDMRTPLNAIISLSRMALEEQPEQAVLIDYMDKIFTSSEYLLGLISNVLELSSLEKGKLTLNPVPVDVVAFLEGTLSIIHARAADKGQRFSLHIHEDIQRYQRLDKVRTGQVLLNLLGNACKYTPDCGHIDYVYSQFTDDDGRLWHRHLISDDGVGISSEFQAVMYEPFSRETNSETTDRNGTGLGLSICRNLVQLMDGTIQVDSQPKQGTTFLVCIPAEPISQQEYLAVQKTRSVVSPSFLAGKRILLCEDHPMNTLIANKLLVKKEMLVENAANGKQGLEMFLKSPNHYYDAILMDIRMPIMDGLEATRRIRASAHPQATTIPMIALSANAFEEDVAGCLEAGMNAHLAKPIEPLKLYGTLEDCMAAGYLSHPRRGSPTV